MRRQRTGRQGRGQVRHRGLPAAAGRLGDDGPAARRGPGRAGAAGLDLHTGGHPRGVDARPAAGAAARLGGAPGCGDAAAHPARPVRRRARRRLPRRAQRMPDVRQGAAAAARRVPQREQPGQLPADGGLAAAGADRLPHHARTIAVTYGRT
ncbi:hypothetical protein SBRY_70005 [Actinacidiphila bryophytorum]|uniref:Uncharacterized protein n=1 Tax=Actinacidiphila bryophytorum TaxID=1436133 RepID=A0A9W4MGU2_9ACTN|nr:hypothetical protein SBRY_70005 [Actinacidiphila bryophytorum]